MLKLSIHEVRQTLINALIRKGMSRKDSIIVAEDYLLGELQGKESHGLMAFPSLLNNFVLPKKNPETILKTHSLLVIDAHNHLGAVVGRSVGDLLMKIAKTEGIGVACIKNITTWLRPGTIAQYIADHNMIGIVCNNGGRPMVAPPGGYDPVIGTNPIGIGIPTTKQPIVVDMATSKRAWGEVKKADQLGTDLPAETYLNNRGSFATKPQDAYSVTPMGDYKGFALGLLIEILTGSFLGRTMGKQQMSGDYQTLTRGAIVIVLNPTSIGNIKQFKKANSDLINEIKHSSKQKGVDEIVLPGERAQNTQANNLHKGYINIDESLWKKISS